MTVLLTLTRQQCGNSTTAVSQIAVGMTFTMTADVLTNAQVLLKFVRLLPCAHERIGLFKEDQHSACSAGSRYTAWKIADYH